MTDIHASPTPAMLIVGAGHVGGRAALTLREAGWTGPIRLIGDEPDLPCERPPLSKAVLTGEQAPEACLLREAAAWDEAGVQWQSARVTALYPVARRALLNSGEVIAYEGALLATGGRARRLGIPGNDLPGVFSLRTLADARALMPRLAPGRRLLVVGGGFIGLEVAASARQRSCSVTVVEGGLRLLGRAVPAALAERVLALHRQQGVDLRLSTGPERFTAAADGAIEAMLSDGDRLLVDTVVVGIGIVPDTALAEAAGLAVANGIVVDRCLATSAPGILAAGDVANFPSVLSGLPTRQETWLNAETQAATAAHNLLGAARPYTTLPWFWSDQYEHQVQVSGEPGLGTQTALRALEGGGELHGHWDAQGRLVGASGFGRAAEVAKDLKIARTLVERGASPSLAQWSDAAVRLKSLLAAGPGTP